mmetsp:Transcript_20365/g.69030  ORF Transcript_20365/g.69030 Transcript_20365/m.69030 type:complete len:226 (-) Transcript_20365:1310-1987(-)
MASSRRVRAGGVFAGRAAPRKGLPDMAAARGRPPVGDGGASVEWSAGGTSTQDKASPRSTETCSSCRTRSSSALAIDATRRTCAASTASCSLTLDCAARGTAAAKGAWTCGVAARTSGALPWRDCSYGSVTRRNVATGVGVRLASMPRSRVLSLWKGKPWLNLVAGLYKATRTTCPARNVSVSTKANVLLRYSASLPRAAPTAMGMAANQSAPTTLSFLKKPLFD